MEHPLVFIDSNLTIAEVQEKTNELQKKLNSAYRLGNAHLAHQIQKALETYKRKLSEMYEQLAREEAGEDGRDLGSYIDIS